MVSRSVQRIIRAAGPLLALLALGWALGPAPAEASSGSGLLVTFVARMCPSYTDINANRARNDIQESLRDLGPDTPYQDGEMMSPTVEQDTQPNCTPLPGWTFTLGSGYISRAVSGPWGSLSIVTGAFAPAITTLPSTPLLDDRGLPTGQTIAGAATIELSAAQASLAVRPNSLWAQGGTPADPILDQRFPGKYAFGALRCALDNLNGDNVEWIGFPSGVRHVFCFAYYVVPPPSSGTIIVRKQVQAPAGTTESFPFQGNLSFNAGGRFDLDAGTGQAGEETFYRAETRPGDPPWEVQELVPPNWTLSGLQCTSSNGTSTTSTDDAAAEASITLAAADTVTCTFTDRLIPPNGGLLIRKISYGATGRFAFGVAPAAGGGGVSTAATTKEAGVAVDVESGPLSLAPGVHAVSETAPATRGGRWALTAVQCDGHDLPPQQPIPVPVASGVGTVCTFTNTFTPLGSLTVAKITEGGVATTGFVISPSAGAPLELHQSATTTRAGVPAVAVGEPARGLELGGYRIQETTPQPAGNGHWELTAVRCGGQYLPFADGAAEVDLSEARPSTRCTFVNTHRRTPPTEPSEPLTPTVDPEADLTITKHALSSHIALGQSAEFRLTVSNSGPGDAREVAVGDQPSDPSTLVAARTSAGTCRRTLPLVCLLGPIAPSHSESVTVVLRPLHSGTFTNRAIVGEATVERTLAHSVATAHLLVVPTATRQQPAFTG